MNVIACHNLTKTYGRTIAADNLSFVITGEKITGLIGRNGAGKTTLLKLAAGYLLPTSGKIEVFSQNPFNNLNVSANMIYIDDQMNLPEQLPLTELLTSAGSFYPNWNHGLATKLLEYFDLSKHPHAGITSLSKGMKSTFICILGIAARTPLTIFDEPTVGMDAAVRKDFYRALLKDYIKHPRTIILSSHLLDEIEDLLDDIILIDDGKKHLHMTVDELREYAVGLQGSAETIDDITVKKDILYQKQLGKSKYVVVRNRYTTEEEEGLRAKNIQISSVAVSDLCVYLTAKHKGGIDDVLDGN